MIQSFITAGVVLFLSTGAIYAEEQLSASPQMDSMTGATGTEAANTGSPAMAVLSIDELAAYNGTNGKPMYVAIEGVLYDVTNVKAWKKGKHKGYTGGTDITEFIKKKSPHGLKVVKNLKAVGTLKK